VGTRLKRCVSRSARKFERGFASLKGRRYLHMDTQAFRLAQSNLSLPAGVSQPLRQSLELTAITPPSSLLTHAPKGTLTQQQQIKPRDGILLRHQGERLCQMDDRLLHRVLGQCLLGGTTQVDHCTISIARRRPMVRQYSQTRLDLLGVETL
jgi:hypothetical protein